jgi:hypothetical protein
MSLPDVTVSSFTLTIDVIHSDFDAQVFIDYAKSTSRKAVIFLHASEFAETSGRLSRSELRSTFRQSLSRCGLNCRAVKTRIDTETAKALDLKRRQVSHDQKRSSRTGTHQDKSPELVTAFGGAADVVFCLIGFPDTPEQYDQLLSAGVDLGAFISLVRIGPSCVPSPRSPGRRLPARRAPLEEVPQRWRLIQRVVDASVVFACVDAPAGVEESWKTLEREIVRIIRCRSDFQSRFEGRTFVTLPLAQGGVDPKLLSPFLRQWPGDLLNAMVAQLRRNLWRPNAPPGPVRTLDDMYLAVFRSIENHLRRQVLFRPPERFEKLLEVRYDHAFRLLYPLRHWRLRDDAALVTRAVSIFYASPTHFHAVAGHQFESLVSQANKRLSLGIPSSFFDWTRWKYSTEHANVANVLGKVSRTALVCENQLEDAVGILWVLAMAPISRTLGQPFRAFFMPPTLDGVSDWRVHGFERPPPDAKERRRPPTPAEVLKPNGLLPPLTTRLFRGTETIYRVPVEFGNSIEFVSPYFFQNGTRVDVARRVIHDSPEFGYSVQFAAGVEATSTNDSVVVSIGEGFRIMWIPGTGTSFVTSDLSVLVTAGDLVVSHKQLNFVMSRGGAVAFDDKGAQRIVCRDGAIGHRRGEGWFWVDANGSGLQTVGKSFVRAEHRHELLKNPVTQVTQMIREDGVKFTIDEKGFRVIEFLEFLTIHQRGDTVIVSFVGLPSVTIRDSEFKFMIDETVVVSTVDRIEVDNSVCHLIFDQEICVSTSEDESFLTPKSINLKSGEFVFVANSSGVQRIGYAVSDTTALGRKIEDVRSRWGKVQPLKPTFLEADQVEMLKVFRPRFFAVRSDLSATEFVHETACDSSELTRKTRQTERHNDNQFRCTTFHHPILGPLSFVEYDVLFKQARQTLLKTLQIPKGPRAPRPKKNQEPVDPNLIIEEALTANRTLLNEFKDIQEICETVKNENEEMYQEERNPKPRPPLPRPAIPVFTPSPRMLRVQAEMNLEEAIQNYWDSPEARFATPVSAQPSLPRPVPPNTRLFNLSLNKKQKSDPPPSFCDEFSVRSSGAKSHSRTLSARVYKTEVSQPQTPHTVGRVIDFGTVKVGEIAYFTFQLPNNGTRPLKFKFEMPTHPCVRVESVPRTVPPGLKLTVKLSVQADRPQMVRSEFTWRTSDGEASIPVLAWIVE